MNVDLRRLQIKFGIKRLNTEEKAFLIRLRKIMRLEFLLDELARLCLLHCSCFNHAAAFSRFNTSLFVSRRNKDSFM